MALDQRFDIRDLKFWGFWAVVAVFSIAIANTFDVPQVIVDAQKSAGEAIGNTLDSLLANDIRSSEGLRLEAYLDIAGVPTIGYGTTVYPDGRRVQIGDTITKEQAEQFMQHDINRFAKAVDEAVEVPLAQHEHNALTSFAYNIGIGGFQQSTTLERLNQGDRFGAADAMTMWNKITNSRGELEYSQGLANRRALERQRFLSPER